MESFLFVVAWMLATICTLALLSVAVTICRHDVERVTIPPWIIIFFILSWAWLISNPLGK